jgi:transposase InsO family protein
MALNSPQRGCVSICHTWLLNKPLFIESGNLWVNGYIESFDGKMRDKLLAREIFYTLKEGQVTIEMWRKHYNTIGPHSSLGYLPSIPVNSASNILYFSRWDYQKWG